MDSRTQMAVNKSVSLAVNAIDQKQSEQIEALEKRVAALEKHVKAIVAATKKEHETK